jgi:3-isopropylmalate/(R)-2-methylmalate dehydratase small subunit
MNSEITGKIIVVGDNIDTDQIYPGCYLALTDPKEIGSHCLSGVDVNIAANAQRIVHILDGRLWEGDPPPEGETAGAGAEGGGADV